jgi:iron complex outermembrane recepter protein
MKQYQRWLASSAGSVVTMALMAGAAWAQTAPAETQIPPPPSAATLDNRQTPALSAPTTQNPDDATALAGESEDIVITGFRASVAAALEDKRQSTGVVDVIRAEDIADFPDNNLAESLQRIPGVAISREGGEGRSISVRGLGPGFTRVRINGMEAVATTGGSDAGGGVNRGRGFDFNVFASELFNSLTVRKTASANIEEGSLGATVDLQAARPFDYRDRFTVAATAQAGYNDLSESVDPRFAGLVSVQNDAGTLGALVSVAYSERTIAEVGHSTVRWSPAGVNGGFNAASTLPGFTAAQLNTQPTADGSNWESLVYHPRIPRYDTWQNNIKRLGITSSIQAKPTERTLLTLEALYSDSDTTRSENYIEAISFSRSGAAGKPQTIIRNGEVNDQNELVYGAFDGVDMRIESRFDILETKFQQYTGTLEHEFSDAFKLTAFGGYAKSAFSSPVQTTIVLDRENSNGYSWDYRDNDREPVIGLGFDPANPANWAFRNGVSDVRIRQNYVDNDFRTGKLFGEWKVTEGFDFLFGGEYRKFTYDSREFRRNVAETSSGTLTPQQIADLSYVIDGVTGDPQYGSYLVPDLQGFIDTLGIYCNCVTTINGQRVDFTVSGLTNATARSNTSTVTEEELAGYGQVNFQLPLGPFTLRGDAGMRYVQTRQTSLGYAVINGAIDQLEVKRRYDNWLPAMNLVAEFTPELFLRFGAAKVITRPGLGSLSPGGSLTIQPSNRVYSTGNPFLDPTEATNLDLSLEWYFATGSLIGVSLFQKDISALSGVQISSLVAYQDLGLPLDLLNGTGIPPTEQFEFRRTVNGEGGKLKGFEVNYQHQLKFLPSFLSNLGILANYTYVDADLEYPGYGGVGPALVGPLTNLSKHSANGTLFYEDKLINLRGSVAYRSGYVEAFAGGAREQSTEEGVNGNLQFDASAAINVMENVSLTSEAINLTNEPKDQYIDRDDRVVLYHRTGRQFYAGVRVRF